MEGAQIPLTRNRLPIYSTKKRFFRCSYSPRGVAQQPRTWKRFRGMAKETLSSGLTVRNEDPALESTLF